MSDPWWPRRDGSELLAYLEEPERAEILAILEPLGACAGDMVFHRDSPSRSLLLVEAGELEVVDEAGNVLGTVGPGGIVGEVGFVDGEARTHDVRARADCELLRLTRERLLASEPLLMAKVLLALGQVLARRFRSAQADLAPIRAFASGLDEPEAPPSFDEIEDIDPVTLVRELARRGGTTGL
jgi:CRP-like cAMP-binding protein